MLRARSIYALKKLMAGLMPYSMNTKTEINFIHMKPISTLLACLTLFFAALTATAQTKFIEKVTRKGNELVIPYEKYQLSNGLTVVIHEDHSDPLVHVDVTYHVGSAREEIGKSGFAHFFEHMMFQGSDNVADEEHFRIVTEAGGTLNGSTNRDRTNYYQTLPSNQLEIALWLEADRMGFLLDAVTQQKFEVQRATVKNERGQNYDNRPYGLVFETVSKNLYPYGHPYSWLTIGYVEDLDRVDVNDLKRFFLRWYGPNNATLTVGGDVDPQQVVRLAEKYFGSIPAGPAVENMPPMMAALGADRYVSYVDNYIRFPMLAMVFPGVPTYHPDKAALDCLANLMGQGKNTVFYQNFTKTQKALNASVSNQSTELAGEFFIQIVPTPMQTLASVEALIRQTLADFESKGISDEDVERFKTQYEAGRISALGSVSGKVSQLAAYETFTGSPNQLPKDLEGIRQLSKEQVMQVYEKYIKGKPAVIASVLPKGGTLAPAAPDNYKIDSTQYAPPKDQYAGLTYNKPKDNFDRSKKPASGPNPTTKAPAYWTKKMPNGIQLIGTVNEEVPTVTMLISFKGGQMLDESGKTGTASLLAQMMNEGTENYTAEAFEEALRNLGGNIRVSASENELTITMSALVKNLDKTLALLEERLFRTKFLEEDFKRLKENTLKNLQNRSTQPATIANDVFAKLLYGANDVRALPIGGTETTVQNITLDDVVRYFQTKLSAASAKVIAVGDIEQKDLLKKVRFLSKMEARQVQHPKFAAPAQPDKTRLYLVDVPKAAQSEIRIGYMALPYDATGDYYKANLMNYNLGGAFNSRINLNLREDKGYTYGARSGFQGDEEAGPFTAAAGVKASATDSSVVEFVKEITLFRDKGITQEELAFLKSSIGQRDALRYETGPQKAGFLNQIIRYQLPKNFISTQNAILNNLSADEVNALAKKYLRPEQAYILVVGDKSLIMPGLQKLGYEIIELSKQGDVVQ